MNTPDPLMIAGHPVVIGSVVHLAEEAVPEPVCVAAIVEAVTDPGGCTLRLRTLDTAQRVVNADYVGKGPAGTWHWPDPNRRQCQGRP